MSPPPSENSTGDRIMTPPCADHILVVIPTYNEAENIVRLIPAVLGQGPVVDILVVDDGSPDGTGKIVRGDDDSGNRGST